MPDHARETILQKQPNTTWSPWHGCVKKSRGCAHCFMYYLDKERGIDGADIHKNTSQFDLIVKKRRNGNWRIPSGTLVRVCMTSDFFLEEADEWRKDAYELMRMRPDLTFFLLTKRPERMAEHLPKDWGDNGWSNVQLNISTEDQEAADERIPILLRVPAHHRGLLCAPLLGPINLSPYIQTGKIHSVSADGENYEGARPCNIEWVINLRNQCEAANVPFSYFSTGAHPIICGKKKDVPKCYHIPLAQGLNLDFPSENFPKLIQERCFTCSYRDKCNGCSNCGKHSMCTWELLSETEKWLNENLAKKPTS